MVKVPEELLLLVDGVGASGRWVGVNLPDSVPVLEEKVLEGDLIVGVVLGVGIAEVAKDAKLYGH